MSPLVIVSCFPVSGPNRLRAIQGDWPIIGKGRNGMQEADAAAVFSNRTFFAVRPLLEPDLHRAA